MSCSEYCACVKLSINKATPSIRSVTLSQASPVPIVEDALLSRGDDIYIRSGRFGSCSLMVLTDNFHVCVKSISSFSVDSVKAETAIMIALNLGGFTPYP